MVLSTESGLENKVNEYSVEDELANLFYARFAYIDRKSHPEEAVSAMGRFYGLCPGISKNDPVIAEAVNKAYAGVQDGNITNDVILSAIGLYGDKEYERLRDNSSILRFISSTHNFADRISKTGGVAKDIAKGYKDILEKIEGKVDYASLKYKDVEDKFKDDKDEKAAKTLTALALIEQGILRLINIDIAQDTAKGTAEGVRGQLKKMYDIE